ncbi:cupredoxin domain-containing protein [Sphingosinicella sp.]|uniref:cupredoxin domain-containing protein n=1 Tax=Sphingosinicella sp. TaxID=1917971 RepID=UPI004037BF2D
MRALLLLACLLPTVALAQDVPRRVEVRLSSFDFTPSTIRLTAGRPVVLHLVNSGDGGHNFAAPEFFAAARGVSGPVERGRVEVAGGQSADIRLTPARGTYRLRCTHTLHTAFGMTGEIVVE